LELWIPITVLAAFSQNIRSALQKHLTTSLTTASVTQVRFLFAIPFAAAYLCLLIYGLGYELPQPGNEFIVYAAVGGLSQVLATAFLIAAFSYRNFFVATAYSKTESIQAAILGFIILGDALTLGASAGIVIGVAGVMTISAARHQAGMGQLLKSLITTPALLGMGSGLFFGISAICFRGASLSLSGGFVVQAAFTLLLVLVLQASVTTLYLVIREPGQLTAIFAGWRMATLVGLTGMIASVGWFTAVTLQNAGYVRALGQVELVFTFIASVFIFREKTNRLEILGVVGIIAGILILLQYS
jgi:drug/metabolite transporter (DMT)-like permease